METHTSDSANSQNNRSTKSISSNSDSEWVDDNDIDVDDIEDNFFIKNMNDIQEIPIRLSNASISDTFNVYTSNRTDEASKYSFDLLDEEDDCINLLGKNEKLPLPDLPAKKRNAKDIISDKIG